MKDRLLKNKTNEGHLADMADMAERDHEVQMARSDLYKLAKYSIKLHDMLKTVSEETGIQGWQQAKITKAADYISSVYHSLDYEMNFSEQSVSNKNTKISATSENDRYVESLQNKLSSKIVKRSI